MRKDAKQRNADAANARNSLSRVQSYHEGGTWGGEEYAFRGFRSNKYFTSDRFIPLSEDWTRADGKPVKGYGLEIETECFSINNQTVLAECLEKIIFAAFPADLFKLQRDGSLTGGQSAAECITQIMTREFIRNHYAEFKRMFDVYFPAFGISAADTGNCGMHVNISRSLLGGTEDGQTEAARKLLYIINKHFSFFCALFYRDERKTGYCARMRQYADRESCKNADLSAFGSSHGICLNLGHWDSGRVEIRLVGGQKNYACFRNTLEAVFFTVARVKSLKWSECDSLAAIFQGCNQYVFDRIRSYCAERGTITADEVESIRASVVREELI